MWIYVFKIFELKIIFDYLVFLDKKFDFEDQNGKIIFIIFIVC